MEINKIKYLGDTAVSYLIEKCKATFALITHKHTAEEVGADASGSASAALALANEYTDEQLATITTGDVIVKESEHSSSADTATNATNAENAVNADNATNAENAKEAEHANTADSATKATQDGNGNVITDIYETKSDASAKLEEAKSYTDTAITNLVNSAPETLDTIGELATAFEENADIVEALNAAITNKADKEHNHSWNDLEDKPFYNEESVEILAETIVEISEETAEAMLETPINLEVGKKYIVSYGIADEEITEFEVVAEADSTGITNDVILWDSNIVSGDMDAVEFPLLISSDGATYTLIAPVVGDVTGRIKIAIRTAEVVHYLDSKYIKDMYYVEPGGKEEEILPSITLTTEEDSKGMFTLESPIELIPGDTYIVNWCGGLIYTCIARIVEDEGIVGYALGNVDAAFGTGNTGEPFVFISSPSQGLCAVMEFDSTLLEATISIKHITGDTIHKINDKYLDLSTKKLSDFNNDLYGDIYELEEVYSANIADLSFTEIESENAKIAMLWNENEDPSFILAENERYSVIVDGVEFICDVSADYTDSENPVYHIGNLFIADSSSQSTDEPFLISYTHLDGTGLIVSQSFNAKTIIVKKIVSDETRKIPAKYLEMPYGEKIEYIFPEQVINVDSNPFMLSSAINFEAGKEYTMIVDGIEYPCVGYSALYNGISFVGIGCEGLIDGTASEFNEPLAIGTVAMGETPVTAIMLPSSDLTSFTLAIKGGVIHKIPGEYVEPCYGEIKGYLVKDFICTEENEGVLPEAINFIEGQTYIVTYNGTDYECVAKTRTFEIDGDSITFNGVGDVDNYIATGTLTAEPFIIATANMYGQTMTMAMGNDEASSFSVQGVTVKYIDSKYIEGMYYSKERMIYPKQSFTFSEYDFVDLGLYIPFVPNRTYIVNYNDVDYECVAEIYDDSDNDAIYVGNRLIYDGGKDIPFCILSDNNNGITMLVSGAGITSASIEIIERDMRKIDNKYIDAEWMATSYDAESVIIHEQMLTEFDTTNNIHSTEADDYSYYEFSVGQKYAVRENGNVYFVNAFGYKEYDNSGVASDYIALGNASLCVSGMIDTGEPFFFIINYSDARYYTTSDITNGIELIISKATKNANIIPEKFLPNLSTKNLSELNNDLFGKQVISSEVVFESKSLEFETDRENSNSDTYYKMEYVKFSVEPQTEYIVKINGRKYLSMSHGAGRGCYIGNQSVRYTYNNSGVPFCIDVYDSDDTEVDIYIHDDDTSDSKRVYTIEILKVTDSYVKKIDKEYVEQPTRLSEFENDLYGELEATEVFFEEQEVKSTISNGNHYYINAWSSFSSSDRFHEVLSCKYAIILDGIKYICTPRRVKSDLTNIIYEIGNNALYPYSNDTALDTKEPFYIRIYFTNSGDIYFDDMSETHMLEILRYTGETYTKQIPSEYIEAPAIPTFDLVEMGLPVIQMDGSEVSVETDTTALIEALEKGSVKLKASVNYGGNIVPCAIIGSAFHMIATGSYSVSSIIPNVDDIVFVHLIITNHDMVARCNVLSVSTT